MPPVLIALSLWRLCGSQHWMGVQRPNVPTLMVTWIERGCASTGPPGWDVAEILAGFSTLSHIHCRSAMCRCGVRTYGCAGPGWTANACRTCSPSLLACLPLSIHGVREWDSCIGARCTRMLGDMYVDATLSRRGIPSVIPTPQHLGSIRCTSGTCSTETGRAGAYLSGQILYHVCCILDG